MCVTYWNIAKQQNFYLFFQRRLYEHIEEMWDFYESHPVVSLFLLLLFTPHF